MSVLERLRRRRRALLRLLLPLAACAWIAGAAACPVAAGDAPRDAVERAGEAASSVHDDHAAHGHRHGGAEGADGSAAGADTTPDGAGGDDRRCAHCPDGHAVGGAAACTALDDADRAAGSAGKDVHPPAAPALAAARYDPPRRPSLHPPARDPTRSAVPLHLRHCVFLI